MIANKGESKAMTEHISCDYKCKFNSTTCDSIKNGIIKHVNVNVKAIISVKKVIVGILAQNSKYLKSVADTSVTECDEIVIVMNNLSIKKTHTITTNVRSTASINCHSKQVRDCYILRTVLLAIILLLIITVICYHYAKQKDIM